jgi:hypothetical protein
VKVRRMPVIWKNHEDRVLIMSKDGVFLLNKKAAMLWKSFTGETIRKEDSWPFIKSLLDLKLIEVSDD